MFLNDTYYYSIYIYTYIYTQVKVNRLSLYIEHDKFWLLFKTYDITMYHVGVDSD